MGHVGAKRATTGPSTATPRPYRTGPRGCGVSVAVPCPGVKYQKPRVLFRHARPLKHFSQFHPI